MRSADCQEGERTSHMVLRGANGGGWEVLVDGDVLLWDADVHRAALAAITVHARTLATQPIELGSDVPPSVISTAWEAAAAIGAVEPSSRGHLV